MNNQNLLPLGTRFLWLLVAVLFSLLVAVVAGVVKSLTGVSLAEAVLFGGGAFAASLGLCVVVRGAIRQT